MRYISLAEQRLGIEEAHIVPLPPVRLTPTLQRTDRRMRLGRVLTNHTHDHSEALYIGSGLIASASETLQGLWHPRPLFP